MKRFRSHYEAFIAARLKNGGWRYAYEPKTIKYIKPEQHCSYLPDFYLPDTDIYIEAKGLFSSNDRKKHLLIQEQHPEFDIRFVFQNSKLPINSRSKTTCGQWCDKHNFKWAHKVIPEEWLTGERLDHERAQ